MKVETSVAKLNANIFGLRHLTKAAHRNLHCLMRMSTHYH